MKISKRQLKRIIRESMSDQFAAGNTPIATEDFQNLARLDREETHTQGLESVMIPVEAIVDRHINDMFYDIQTRLGATSGDIAAMHWANIEDQFMAMIEEYVQAEQAASTD